jgi:uncharacterized protein (DUF305 family)
MTDVARDVDEPDLGDATDEASDEADADEDVVVLAWWQHPLNIVTLLVSTALVAGMIGWLIADAAGEERGGEVDIGFLQDMREHHEQGVTMAFVYLNLEDTSPGLRSVARSIVLGQSTEIGRMIQLLRNFGAAEAAEGDVRMLWMGMSAAPGLQPGMATEEELLELGAASGTEADDLFVTLMVRHHLGALDMAEFAVEQAESAEVRAMAAGMAAGQRGEIAELESLRP